VNEQLARDALKTIEALKRRVAQLETELQKSRGTSGPAGSDRAGLKGAISDATSRGLPNSFAVRGADPGDLISKAHARKQKKQ